MTVLRCRRDLNLLRAENLRLQADLLAKEASLNEFMITLKTFRRDVLGEIASLSDRLSLLEDSRGMDSYDTDE